MRLQKQIIIGASLVLLLYALFTTLNAIGLRAEESRRAVTGIEVYKSGNIIVPQIHGKPYYNKPPLFSCVLATSYYLTGTLEEWAVRLPGIIAFLLIGLISFFVARSYTDTETAYIAMMAFFTTADLLFYSTINAGEIDLFFTFITFAQTISIFVFYQKKQYLLLFVCSYLLAALGTLTKGMPSIAIQAITISAYLIYYKDWKNYFSLKHLAGIGLFLFVVVGYFYLYSQQNDVIAFIENLYKESSKRTISEMPLMKSIKGIAEFPMQIAILLLPWSLLAIYLFRKNIRSIIKSNPYLLFSVIFILANIVLYWLSPRFKNRYVYFFLPSFTFILAFFYTKYKESESKLTLIIENIWLSALAIASIALLVLPFIHLIDEPVNHAAIYSILFSLLFAFLFWLSLKSKDIRIHLFILALIIGRIAFNILFVPQLNREADSFKYQKHAEKLAELSKGEPIYFTGDSFKIKTDVSIFNFKLTQNVLYTPPLIPYQIPYYLSRKTNNILPYTTTTESGKLYLVHLKYLKDRHINILYTFVDKWDYDKKMILYRKK